MCFGTVFGPCTLANEKPALLPPLCDATWWLFCRIFHPFVLFTHISFLFAKFPNFSIDLSSKFLYNLFCNIKPYHNILISNIFTTTIATTNIIITTIITLHPIPPHYCTLSTTQPPASHYHTILLPMTSLHFYHTTSHHPPSHLTAISFLAKV